MSLPSSQRRWLIAGDANGLSAALAARLEQRGQAIARDLSDGDVLVHLTAVEDGRAAFDELIALARELGRTSQPLQLIVVSTRRHDVLGTEPLDARAALVAGPLRVIPQEYPHVTSRGFDLDVVDADALASELLRPADAGSYEIAIRGGQRWTLGYDDALQTPSAAAPFAEGAHVIFGGFGNIGRVAAQALLAKGATQFVLAARRADAHHPAVERLRAAGARVVVAAADVSRVADVRAALRLAREQFGRVAGIVNTAGVVGEAAMAALTDIDAAHVERQFTAKLAAAHAIAAVADEFAPDYVLLTSSLASVLGGLGFAAYAAANAYVDAFATSQKRGRWISIDWDGWRFDGLTTPESIDAARGAQAFAAVLDGVHAPQVLAVAGELAPRLERWINPGTQHAAAPAQGMTRSRNAAGRPATTDMQRLVLATWHELLGIDGLGLDDDFFELGGHSLLATQLISRLRMALKVDVPLRVVFEHPGAEALAQALEGLAGPATTQPTQVIGPRTGNNDLPLSSQQRRLWFLHRLDPSSVAYIIPGIVRVTGALDVGALTRALQTLVQRHESLRTTFASRDGQPVQVIAPSATMPVRIVEAAEGDLAALTLTELATPFDLEHGPVARASVLRVSSTDHVVILTTHHIVSDGWSIAVLIREFVALYEQEITGRPAALAPPALQYADFAVWQQSWRQEADAQKQLAYWTRQLANLPRVELPTDRPRAADGARAGGTVRGELDAATTAAVRRFCNDSGATLFMTLLAAYAAWLHRYTGQVDLPIGTPSANRNRAELEGIVGFFVNSLVVRADVSGTPSFRDLVDRIKTTCLDAWANQDVPFEDLVDALQPERTPGWQPLFQVMFILQNAPEGRLELPGLSFEPFDVVSPAAKFDTSLYAVETGDTIQLLVEFARDIFDEATAARMLEHYVTLLRAAVGAPEQPIAGLSLLTSGERALVTKTWNETATAYPRERSVHSLFEEQAGKTPDAIAVRFGEATLTYRELNARADDIAARLQDAGVSRGMMVGFAAERSLEMLAGILGILKAGAAYLPLDSSYPRERLTLLLREGNVQHVVVQPALAEALPLADLTTIALETAGLATRAYRKQETHPDDPAYVMFTSGSTGAPKGVVVPHRAIVRLVRDTNYVSLAADEVILQFAPLSFDASTFEIWGALLNGGSVAIAPPGPASLSDLGRTLTTQRVTTAWLTAGLFHQMVEHQLDSLRSLRQLVAGGDVLQPDAVRRVLSSVPGIRMVNGFGPTETTTFACCHVMRSAAGVGRTVSIGGPIANSRAYVLDERGNPAPIGVPGELFLGGDGLAHGYLNQPALTAERFVPDAFSGEPGGRLYRTGDRARWLPNGTLEFLGRRDHQVKIRGFRVEPGEIEAALLALPGVTAAHVQVHVAETGDKRLVAYVVAEPAARAAGADPLIAVLGSALPAYMVPSAVVMLDALPLTRNGKIDRRALPDPEAAADDRRFVAPRTPEETAVAAIWCEVLQLPRVGADDDFFMLGGHSLLATQVMARVLDQFGVEVPLRALFTEPTVAALAREIVRARAERSGAAAGIQSIPRSSARRRT